MAIYIRGGRRTGTSTGLFGGVVLLVVGFFGIVVMGFALLIALGLMAVVAVVAGADRLLGAIVPAYRRRRRGRYVRVPMSFSQMPNLRFAKPELIEARSSEVSAQR